MELTWNGWTLRDTLHDPAVEARDEVADRAGEGRWPELLEYLSQYPVLANSWRLGEATWFTSLHHAAYLGAPRQVIERLLELGAWRTLRTAAGERAVDIASQRGHDHLRPLLTPVHVEPVHEEALAAIQRAFHDVIRGRAREMVSEHQLRLPELGPLTEVRGARFYCAVPGMYGGFKYWLETSGGEPELVSESWSRVASGSGQRHRVTPAGATLVAKGFI